MRSPGETGHTSAGEAPRTYWKIIRQTELRKKGDLREEGTPESFPKSITVRNAVDLLLEFRDSKWKGVDFRRPTKRPGETSEENHRGKEQVDEGEAEDVRESRERAGGGNYASSEK